MMKCAEFCWFNLGLCECDNRLSVTQRRETSPQHQRLPATSINALYGVNLRRTAFDLRFALREVPQNRNYPVNQGIVLHAI